MRRLSRLGALALVAAALAPAAASAQPLSPPVQAPAWGTRIDPTFDALFAHRARFGATLPAFLPSARFERDGTLPVVVRFARVPDVAALDALARHGVAWGHDRAAYASGAYGARVDERALAALAQEPAVARVMVDLHPVGPAPLDASAEETRVAPAVRAQRMADGTELDGRGTLVVDIDSGVFVFHPSLFRADAGVFPWVDVNGDGALTVGVDGVDLDRDGSVAPAETLRLLVGDSVTRVGTPIGPRATSLRPNQDWLYLDTNGNGRRDYGAEFPEDTPAYGEPLFALDDADRDGRASLAERLYRLGSSRVRTVVSEQDYVRGGGGETDLVQYDLRDEVEMTRLGHGTGVAGILVGGLPGFSRWTGLAPGADLITMETRSLGERMGTTGGIQRAIDLGASVILTEYAPYAGVTLDGSSEQELLLDAAVGRGTLAVSPAGNLASGAKHRRVRLAPGPNAVAMVTDAGFAEVRSIQFSVHYAGAARDLGLSLTVAGTAFPLPATAPRGVALADGAVAYVTERVTARGTRERHVLLYSPRSAFPRGEYAAAFTLGAGAPLDVDLYVGDDRNSWARGITFDRNDPTRTLCSPSTSDRTLAVGAYVLHGEMAYSPAGMAGALASYTSRGPRFDGDPGIDLVAPDNPMSLLSPTEPGATGGFSPFGGTSGAGPHVAAAVALLRQRYPDATGDELRARLVDHARTDRVDLDAPAEWGHGRLDVAAALGLTPATGRAPAVSLQGPARVRAGRDVTLAVRVTDDGDASALRARWDLDYDGTPDTDWVPVADRVIPTGEPGVVAVRVEVRDADGYVMPAVARVEAVRDLPDPADAGADGGTGGGTVGDGEGCGCGVVGAAPSRAGAWIGLALLGLVTTRRRRAGAR